MSVCYCPLVFSDSANKYTAHFHPKIHKDRTAMSDGNDALYYKLYRIGHT